QPGVRQGLSEPHQYVDSNIVGFTNVLDMCRRMPPRHLLYASSSSVYGANTEKPWSEDHATEVPVSLYAATKKANELMAHSYSHITGVPMTGIRFFTVYGEWGRPDMAPYMFRVFRPCRKADHGFQSWQDDPGLHVCRRRRRGGGAHDRRSPRSKIRRRRRDQPGGAAPSHQCRIGQSGRYRRFHPHPGKSARPRSHYQIRGACGGRRNRYLCLDRAPAQVDRLRPVDAVRNRAAEAVRLA
ncbi:MAG: NAD-dependent epimerase/dehydratase family protein, partial [Rhizobiales bacterium]|nr:NAD-dependent epimerase/dehydratase family protein [Hyphomicrobiales bacterium]